MNSSLPADTVIRHARDLSSRIVERAEAGSIETIFAGGSVARGEVAAVEVGGVLEILSDIDLYVVVADDADEADVRRAARAAVGESVVGEGVRYLRPHDVGVYTREDFLSQPSRPGTANLAREHLLLHGDGKILQGMSILMDAPMDPSEGLYLIENRLTERHLLDRGPRDEHHARLSRFYDVKVCLDAAAAELVAAGRYSAQFDVRLERLRGLDGEAEVPPVRIGTYERAWQAWRELPDYVVGASRVPLDAGEAVVTAVDAWRRIALRALPGSDGSWRALIDHRCHFGDYVHNFRQFLVVCKRQGRRRRDVAWTGIGLARYAPLDALRVAALVGYAKQGGDAPGDDEWLAPLEDYLRGLAAVCGYGDGDVLERAVDMCQAVR